MGTLDETRHTLSCPACGTKESARVLDKGNIYSGSSWQSGATFTNFETSWEGNGGKQEPQLKAAVCKRCGADVQRE